MIKRITCEKSISTAGELRLMSMDPRAHITLDRSFSLVG